MATESCSLSESLKLEGGLAGAWRAYHIFYHADQSWLLRQLIRPLLSQLLRGGVIDRAFFVRYELGGPHVRLRWRALDEGAAAVAEAALADRAQAFFARWPSAEPLAEERIRRTNRILLGVDPLTCADDDRVFPDNSWCAAPLRFEVERYGGLQRLGASLDLFTLSSVRVLQLLDFRDGPGIDWVRPAYMRLALHLAWGLAADEEDFLDLAGYALRLLGQQFAPCVDQGDLIFVRRQRQLIEMVRGEIVRLTSLDHGTTGARGPATGLAAAGRQLADEMNGLRDAARWHLAASHIHMTANRLGLLNATEVYLSHVLWRTIGALRHEEPRAWLHLWRRRASFDEHACRGSLAALAASALAELAA